MAVVKRILCPGQVRRVPQQFSWIDQRLLSAGYLERCRTEALALYVLLVLAGDKAGLSYYSDRSLGKLLGVDGEALTAARTDLIRLRLIAYEPPLYQVLDLTAVEQDSRRGGAPVALGQVLEALRDKASSR